jgi:hypothetical protein
MNYLLESLRLIVQTLALLMLKEKPDSFRYTDQQSKFFQTLSYNTAPLKIVTDSTVREVAQLMSRTYYQCTNLSRIYQLVL